MRRSFFLMQNSFDTESHCLFQIMNGKICFFIFIQQSEKVPLFFSGSQKPHRPYYGCCERLLPELLPDFREKYQQFIPSVTSLFTDTVQKLHFLILHISSVFFIVNPSFKQIRPLLPLLLYQESYKSIRSICAVSTILVPESILDFWI